MALVPEKLWVAYEKETSGVPTYSCSDIDDFIRHVKTCVLWDVDSIPTHRMALHGSVDADRLPRKMLLTTLCAVDLFPGSSTDKPLFLKVQSRTQGQQQQQNQQQQQQQLAPLYTISVLSPELEQEIRELTMKVIDDLIGPRLDTLPGVKGLSQRLNAPIEPIIPLKQELYRRVGNSTIAYCSGDKAVAWDVETSFVQGLSNLSNILPNFASEMDMVFQVQLLVWEPLRCASQYSHRLSTLNLSFTQDTAEGPSPTRTTTGGTRHDFRIVISQQFSPIHGELKANVLSKATAIDELTSKLLEWNTVYLGEIPYLIGVVVAGNNIDFYAICRPQHGSMPKVVPIAGPFDISSPYGRQYVMLAFFRLIGIMEQLYSLIPSGSPPLFGIILRRSAGKRLEFLAGSVKLEVSMTPYRKNLQELYERLLTKGSDFLLCPKAMPRLSQSKKESYFLSKRESFPDSNGSLWVDVTPICRKVLPTTLLQVFCYVFDILAALQHLHRLGFVHRDIRLPNIMQGPKGLWILIDLDDAAKLDNMDAEWPHWGLSAGVESALKLAGLCMSGRWSMKHDLAMLAFIVQDFSGFDQDRSMLSYWADLIRHANDAHDAMYQLSREIPSNCDDESGLLERHFKAVGWRSRERQRRDYGQEMQQVVKRRRNSK